MVQRAPPAAAGPRCRSTLNERHSAPAKRERNPCIRREGRRGNAWILRPQKRRAQDDARLRGCAGSLGRCPALPLVPSLLYTRWFLERSAIVHAEAHIPTQPAPPFEDARLPPADEDPGRTQGAVAPPGPRAQAGLGQPGLPGLAGRRPCPAWRISGFLPQLGCASGPSSTGCTKAGSGILPPT